MLSDDFQVFSPPYWENTAIVIPPCPELPTGRIVISAGQYIEGIDVTGNRSPVLLSRPLTDAAGNVDVTSPTTARPFEAGPAGAIGTDNQIVRLRDGRLLAVRNGSVWSWPPWRSPAQREERLANRPGWLDEWIAVVWANPVTMQGNRGA